MRLRQLALCSILLMSVIPAFAQEGLPVHGNPKWYTIVGSVATSGTAVMSRSVSTGALLGELPPGYKFLSFGANSSWVTLAVNGQVGYIPAAAAAPLYQAVNTAAEWRSGDPTLEEIAEQNRKRRDESKNQPLYPDFLKKPETPGAGGMGMAGLEGGGAAMCAK